MTVKRLILSGLVLAFTLIVLPVSAQNAGPTVIASGLNNPRGIYYNADGVLYIAEAGTGGDTELPGPFGTIKVGGTARVMAVAADGGEAGPVLVNLPSSEDFGGLIGVNDVYEANNAIWFTVGIGPDQQPFNRALIAVDQKNLRVQQYVEMYGIEATTNPDGDPSSVASNPDGFDISEDGTAYIADSSANAVYSWTFDGGLKLFHVWKDDLPVPTTVAIGPDGDIYVGFLSAFPYIAGTSRVERYAVDGTLKETYPNLSFVTTVLVTKDNGVYAVQMADNADDTGFTPNSGSIVKLSTAGTTPVATGLNYPYGLAQAPDGSFAVSINSAFGDAGTGEVINIGKDSGTPFVMPAATTEATATS